MRAVDAAVRAADAAVRAADAAVRRRRAVGVVLLSGALCAASAACSGGGTSTSTQRSGASAGGSTAPARTSTPRPSPRAPACVTAAVRRTVRIRSGGVARQFLLATPRIVGRAPVVVVFHGFAQTATFIDGYTRLPAAGVADGFVVATPQGLADRWNFPRRFAIGPDDVAFLAGMVHWLTRHACADPRRVFVTGFSDGADMADTAACVRPDLVRAVAAVAASVVPDDCTRPVDVLQIHGDEDPIVPFEGGGGDRAPPFEGTEPVSAYAQFAAWRTLDRCSGGLDAAHPAPSVRLVRAKGCRGGHQVALMVIEGGGHTWPGARESLPFGRTVRTISATYRILYFFRHLPEA